MAIVKSERSPKSPSKGKPANLAQVAFERLRLAILTGEIKEGDRLKESRLAAEWNIGITPMREAVRRMAAIGYLVLEPNRAPLIRQLTAQDIGKIYELREILECFALRATWDIVQTTKWEKFHKLIAKVESAVGQNDRLHAQFRLDNALHQLWVSPAQNPWLAHSLERLIIYRPNLMSLLSTHLELAEEAFEQHKQILTALEQPDLEKSIHLLGLHIKKSGSVLSSLTRTSQHQV